MRIGILGGTFDPVHFGHLLVAESCREQLQLDQVRFVPAGDPPHKPGRPLSQGKTRVEMLRLAIAGCSSFVVDPRELDHAGPTFTVDTLTSMTGDFPDDQLYFLMGADSLRDFATWKTPERIAQLAELVVCNRPGVALPTSEQIEAWVGPMIARRTTSVRIPGVDVSATELRDRVRDHRSLRFLTPRSVEVCIEAFQLYR